MKQPLGRTGWRGKGGWFDFMVTVDFAERLIGDKAYDSDKLDARM